MGMLRVSSFKLCVGFGARPRHRLLFEKSIGAKRFISVKRFNCAAKGRNTKQEHTAVMLFHLADWEVANITNY